MTRFVELQSGRVERIDVLVEAAFWERQDPRDFVAQVPPRPVALDVLVGPWDAAALLVVASDRPRNLALPLPAKHGRRRKPASSMERTRA